MELDLEGFLGFWYDSWLVLIGFAAALVLTILLATRGNWKGQGLTVRVVLILAVLAALPLMMFRVSVDIAMEHTPAAVLNVLATFVALLVGIPALVYESRRQGEAPLAEMQESGATGAGTTMQTDTGELQGEAATIAEDATPLPGGEAATLAGVEAPPSDEATLAPTAWLHFKTGPRAGQSIPVSPGTMTIGRGAENDVVMDDATVSRHHANITYQDGQYYAEDSGSMSGTMVEGIEATRTLLASGASLQLGETEVVFMHAEPSAGPGTASGTAAGSQGPGETMVMEQAEGVMAWLAVTAGPPKGKTYQLKVGDNTIGRGSDNDLVLEDRSASRNHAMIKVQGHEFVLVDLGSSGGTKVAGETLKAKEIKPGSVLSLGRTKLNLVEVEAGEESDPGTISGETIVGQPGGGSGGVLIAQSGPDAGKSFPLSQGDNSIGRDTDSAVLLTDDTVSRTHALVRRDEDRFLVFDLGSRTGIQVDGESLSGHKLSVGDTVTIGKTEMVLMQVPGQQG